MTDETKTSKIDISSAAIEKGIDVAKDFAEKLVLPSIEELGLLVKDQISFWRFNNQVKILTKAKLVCEKNNINIKAIPPKLLCPYLEHAALEDDPEIQDNWAILLSNMVDSRQNIQNHIFPYILSQLSKNEFNFLEGVFKAKRQRVMELTKDLIHFQESRSDIERQMQEKKAILREKLNELKLEGQNNVYRVDTWPLSKQLMDIDQEISRLSYRELGIKHLISKPQAIPEQDIEEFEIANIIRLGLAKVVYEASAPPQSIEIPGGEHYEYNSVDLDIQIDTDTKTILTELGELFVEACSEK
jgi:hypothetical protein